MTKAAFFFFKKKQTAASFVFLENRQFMNEKDCFRRKRYLSNHPPNYGFVDP